MWRLISLSGRIARRAKLAIVIYLLLTLMACTTTVTKVVKMYPPAELLQPCVADSQEIRTNADLVLEILANRKALELCDNDKTALRLWSE